MEQNNDWEQPNNVGNVPVADAKIDDSTTSPTPGSQFGKFKDAESLYSAYNNLQAEFTRKCQKLSELEKLKQESQTENSTSDLGQKEQSETSPCETDQKAVFEQENWQTKVANFLETHENAKQFASEISEYILKNPELKTDKNALDIAWAKVVSEKYQTPEKLLGDDKFVEQYIMQNDQIKQKVLSLYLKDIESKKLPPFVTSTTGGNITFQTERKATTLNEAKQLVEAMLKSNL